MLAIYFYMVYKVVIRGVAQPGRVLGLGPRCRMFESCRPDHKIKPPIWVVLFYVSDGMRRTCDNSMFGWSVSDIMSSYRETAPCG